MLHIIVPKRKLKLAVDRNRARRRVRAALDKIKPDWRQELSGSLHIEPEVLALPFPELKTKIVFLLQKARIIK